MFFSPEEMEEYVDTHFGPGSSARGFGYEDPEDGLYMSSSRGVIRGEQGLELEEYSTDEEPDFEEWEVLRKMELDNLARHMQQHAQERERLRQLEAITRAKAKGCTSTSPTSKNDKDAPSPGACFRPEELFSKRAVATTVTLPEKSALSVEFAAADGTSDAGGALLPPLGENPLALTVYLPNRQPLQIQVPKVSTAETVTMFAMHQMRQLNRIKELPFEDPGAYELRMHEGDGEPEDFGIDKLADIAQFGDDEFCMCLTSEAREAARLGKPEAAQGPPTSQRSIEHVPGHVKVLLSNGESMTIKIDPSWTARDILFTVAKKRPRVRLASPHEYEFHLLQDDARRLGFWADHSLDAEAGVVPLEANVTALDIHTLSLHRRTYADQGRAMVREIHRQRRVSEHSIPSDVPVEEVLKRYYLRYTEMKALLWEEWHVIKLNPKKGKPQNRKMGVGREPSTGELLVTNDKLDTSVGLLGVTTAKRDIRTIKSVSLPQPTTVEIVWEKMSGPYTLHYRPQLRGRDSPEEALNIACKLLFLMDLAKKSQLSSLAATVDMSAGGSSGIGVSVPSGSAGTMGTPASPSWILR